MPNLHPSQYIFVGLDGLSYCQNSITTIINKGQVLGPDEFFRIKITKLIIPGDALEFEDSLWTSDDEMPPGQKVHSNCHPGSLPPRRFHLYSETREQRQMPAFTELAKITTILRDKRPDIDFRKFRTLTGSVWYKVDYEILFYIFSRATGPVVFRGTACLCSNRICLNKHLADMTRILPLGKSHNRSRDHPTSVIHPLQK